MFTDTSIPERVRAFRVEIVLSELITLEEARYAITSALQPLTTIPPLVISMRPKRKGIAK